MSISNHNPPAEATTNDDHQQISLSNPTHSSATHLELNQNSILNDSLTKEESSDENEDHVTENESSKDFRKKDGSESEKRAEGEK